MRSARRAPTNRTAQAARNRRRSRPPRYVAARPRARLWRSRGSAWRRFRNGPPLSRTRRSPLCSRLLARSELLVTLREELDQPIDAVLLDLLVELLLIG